MAAYPRLRVFPLAWLSVMPGLVTSRLTVCWFSVVTLDYVTWVTVRLMRLLVMLNVGNDGGHLSVS